MRAVMDTVVYVRAMINPGSRWGRLIFELAERYTVIYSRRTVEEVLDVLSRTELRHRFPQINDVSMVALTRLFDDAEIFAPESALNVSRDPKDNKFFECAVAGRADFIISEDKDILDVGEYEGIKTVTAAQSLEILDAQAR
jgi:putative PIN family toxin of toxin-antitoxin system